MLTGNPPGNEIDISSLYSLPILRPVRPYFLCWQYKLLALASGLPVEISSLLQLAREGVTAFAPSRFLMIKAVNKRSF